MFGVGDVLPLQTHMQIPQGLYKHKSTLFREKTVRCNELTTRKRWPNELSGWAQVSWASVSCRDCERSDRQNDFDSEGHFLCESSKSVQMCLSTQKLEWKVIFEWRADRSTTRDDFEANLATVFHFWMEVRTSRRFCKGVVSSWQLLLQRD